MSDICTINTDPTSDHKHHSSWNDLLRASGLPLHRQGHRTILSHPPPGLPRPSRLYLGNIDVAYLLKLPEFQHWKDAEFGKAVMHRDLELLTTGRMALVDLFWRGAVVPAWYDRFFKEEPDRAEPCFDELVEKFDGLVLRLQKVERAIAICEQAREGSVREHRPSHQRSTCLRHREGRSTATENVHPNRSSRVQDMPVSPRTVPTTHHSVRLRPQLPKPDIVGHSNNSSANVQRNTQDNTNQNAPQPEKEPLAHILAAHISHNHTQPHSAKPSIPSGIPLPSSTPATPSQDDIQQPSQHTGPTPDIVLKRFKKDTEALEELARIYRARYEERRARFEGADAFAPGDGDVQEFGEGSGSGSRKGKEVVREG